MARGDLTVFNEAKQNISELFNLSTTTDFSIMLINNTTVPTAADATPDSSDYTECSAGGGYSSGGIALTTSWTESSGTVTFDISGSDPSWTAAAGSPTDIYYAIFYSETAVGEDALLFIDMGGPVSLVDGDVSINVNASGLFDHT